MQNICTYRATRKKKRLVQTFDPFMDRPYNYLPFGLFTMVYDPVLSPGHQFEKS